MRILNLNWDGHHPYGEKASEILYKSFMFKGGEPHIQIHPIVGPPANVMIIVKLTNMNALIKMCLAVEALRRMKGVLDIYLYAAYLPGARQDRVVVPGEPLTCKVIADIINSQGFKEVVCVDAHSDVMPALINNCRVVPNYSFIQNVIVNIDEWKVNIVSPYAGSNKKMKDLLVELHNRFPRHEFNLIKCDKTRDVTTGKITGFEVYNKTLIDGPLLIVDDICDGGGTFIGLAKELLTFTDNVPIYLAVTHGIFSNGFNALNTYFDRTYCTDSFIDPSNKDVKLCDVTIYTSPIK